MEACKEVEKTKADVPRKQFLNPLMQEINKIKPVTEERAAAAEKVEHMRNLRKVTPNFTLQTRKKVNDDELVGARGSLKKVGGVEELESKLTKINQENYKRMKELSAKPEEIEFLQQRPKKESVVSSSTSVQPTTSNTIKPLSPDNQDDSDSDASLVEMLQSIIQPLDGSDASDIDEDDEGWDSKEDNSEEDIVSFLLSNVMPRRRGSSNQLLKKQDAKNEEIANEAIEKKVEKRLEDIKMRIEMKMEKTKEEKPATTKQGSSRNLLQDINEPERKRLENLDAEILKLGRELEDLKTQTIISDGVSDDDDLDEEEDPFEEDDDDYE